MISIYPSPAINGAQRGWGGYPGDAFAGGELLERDEGECLISELETT